MVSIEEDISIDLWLPLRFSVALSGALEGGLPLECVITSFKLCICVRVFPKTLGKHIIRFLKNTCVCTFIGFILKIIYMVVKKK